MQSTSYKKGKNYWMFFFVADESIGHQILLHYCVISCILQASYAEVARSLGYNEFLKLVEVSTFNMGTILQ